MGTEPIVAIRTWRSSTDGAVGDRAAPAQFPRLVTGGVQAGLNVNPKTGKMVFTHHTAQAPAEVYIAGPDGSGLTQLTHHNAPLISQLDLPKLEGFSFPGSRRRRSSRLAACTRRDSTPPRNTRSSS